MRIIGLLGGAGSGKSTVSNLLVEKFGAKKYAFADPLKRIVQRAFDFSDSQMWGSQSEKEAIDNRYGVSPRWLLQRIGTEGIRSEFGPDVWWDICLARILDERPALAVIEDFRFVNEVEGFLSINQMVEGESADLPVMIWRIESPKQVSSADPEHASEAEWTQCRYTHLIKPEVYGLLPLFSRVEEICAEAGILEVAKAFGHPGPKEAPAAEPVQSIGATDPTEATPRCLKNIGENGVCDKPYNHEPDEECKGWSGFM